MKKLVLLTCILALIATAALAVGCGGTSTSNSPQDAAQKFMQAIKDKNVDAEWAVISKDSQAQVPKASLSNILSQATGVEKVSWTIGKTTVNGNNATVKVTIKESGQKDVDLTVVQVKEGGVWKVNFMKTMQSGQ